MASDPALTFTFKKGVNITDATYFSESKSFLESPATSTY
jgi:hypothetical protein